VVSTRQGGNKRADNELTPLSFMGGRGVREIKNKHNLVPASLRDEGPMVPPWRLHKPGNRPPKVSQRSVENRGWEGGGKRKCVSLNLTVPDQTREKNNSPTKVPTEGANCSAKRVRERRNKKTQPKTPYFWVKKKKTKTPRETLPQTAAGAPGGGRAN